MDTLASALSVKSILKNLAEMQEEAKHLPSMQTSLQDISWWNDVLYVLLKNVLPKKLTPIAAGRWRDRYLSITEQEGHAYSSFERALEEGKIDGRHMELLDNHRRELVFNFLGDLIAEIKGYDEKHPDDEDRISVKGVNFYDDGRRIECQGIERTVDSGSIPHLIVSLCLENTELCPRGSAWVDDLLDAINAKAKHKGIRSLTRDDLSQKLHDLNSPWIKGCGGLRIFRIPRGTNQVIIDPYSPKRGSE